jgi:hypothetical protein
MEELLLKYLKLAFGENHFLPIGASDTDAHTPDEVFPTATSFYCLMAVGGDVVMESDGTLPHNSDLNHPADWTAKEGVQYIGNWKSVERASGSGQLFAWAR